MQEEVRNRQEINNKRLKSDLKKKKGFGTTTKILGGFLVAILIGTALLSLPIATVTGETNVITALFTSTTCVCVTGLVVVPTFSYWTLFGKIIILILIQLGGLGIVTLTSIIAMAINRKFTLKSRMMIQDSFGLDTLQGVVVFIKRVVKGTLMVELLGALLYMVRFIPQFGILKGIWFSVFTSISAFCNAGIDIIGPNSLMNYADSPFILGVTSMMIILGGLGFVVWWDVLDVFKKFKNKKIRANRLFRELKTHSKIVLTMTFALLVSAAFFTLILEYHNPQTLGDMPLGQKLLNAGFQSVTLRTAGFAAVDQGGLTESTVLISLIYMMVGGSPVGTAGGIKTVTLAVLIYAVLAIVKGNNETVVFKQTINTGLIRRSLAVTMVSMFMSVLFIVLLMVTNHTNITDSSYEVVSALATVGLSRNLTDSLNTVGKVIIIICMYLGRIGPITLFTFLASRSKKTNSLHYSEAKIMVG